MDALWRLMTAIFLLALGCGLFVVAYLVSNGRFKDVFSVLLAYGALGCILAGTVKGLVAVLSHNKKDKTEE